MPRHRLTAVPAAVTTHARRGTLDGGVMRSPGEPRSWGGRSRPGACRGRNAAVGNFRTFLDAVKTGRVPPVGVLAAESFGASFLLGPFEAGADRENRAGESAVGLPARTRRG